MLSEVVWSDVDTDSAMVGGLGQVKVNQGVEVLVARPDCRDIPRDEYCVL